MLIIFDLDGVLVDACEWHKDALNDALREVAGFEISEEEHKSTFNGLPTRVKLNMLTQANRLSQDVHDEVYRVKQEKTLEIIGKSKGGHSSMPPSKTAVGNLAEALIKLEENPLPGKLEGLSLELFDNISRHMSFQRKILFANLWLFEHFINRSLSKSPSMNAVIRTTTAPTMLSASERANVLATNAI